MPLWKWPETFLDSCAEVEQLHDGFQFVEVGVVGLGEPADLFLLFREEFQEGLEAAGVHPAFGGEDELGLVDAPQGECVVWAVSPRPGFRDAVTAVSYSGLGTCQPGKMIAAGELF